MMAFLAMHLPILPIVVPLVGAALALIAGDKKRQQQRIIAVVSVLLLLAFGVLALQITASGQLPVYLVGNWRAPFGITLAIDKLSAIMLMLTAVIGSVVLSAAQSDVDAQAHEPGRVDEGTFFTPLFLLLLTGLNGAFLTMDLFNLFVFFEVSLAASYGLLLQHIDRARTNAATHYVAINLTGSALFLIGVSLLYGLTGTLSMADLSLKINAVPPESRALVMSAGFMLLVVFAIKAALLPLNFWLAGTYGRAVLPVAAIFALMTKVGIVAIARLLTLIYPDGSAINLHMNHALLIIAPLTMLAAACGVLSARDVKTMIGWSVVGSAGLLVTALAIGTPKAISGALFYLVGSTVAVALLFLNAAAMDSPGTPPTVATASGSTNHLGALVGALFVVGAAAVTGFPPFPGFIGEAVILAAAVTHPWATWIFSATLISSFLAIIAYARLGSRLFWKRNTVMARLHSRTYAVPTLVLAALLAALTILAAPIQKYTDQAAIEMKRPQIISINVLGKLPRQRDQKPEMAK